MLENVQTSVIQFSKSPNTTHLQTYIVMLFVFVLTSYTPHMVQKGT